MLRRLRREPLCVLIAGNLSTFAWWIVASGAFDVRPGPPANLSRLVPDEVAGTPLYLDGSTGTIDVSGMRADLTEVAHAVGVDPADMTTARAASFPPGADPPVGSRDDLVVVIAARYPGVDMDAAHAGVASELGWEAQEPLAGRQVVFHPQSREGGWALSYGHGDVPFDVGSIDSEPTAAEAPAGLP